MVCGVVVFDVRGWDGAHSSGSGIWWIGGARQFGWKPFGWAGMWGPPPSSQLVAAVACSGFEVLSAVGVHPRPHAVARSGHVVWGLDLRGRE